MTAQYYSDGCICTSCSTKDPGGKEATRACEKVCTKLVFMLKDRYVFQHCSVAIHKEQAFKNSREGQPPKAELGINGTQEIPSYYGGTIMVWAGIRLGG